MVILFIAAILFGISQICNMLDKDFVSVGGAILVIVIVWTLVAIYVSALI